MATLTQQSLPLHFPFTTKFKIALCQLVVTPSKKVNIETARRSIEFAVDHGASLVVLPVSPSFAVLLCFFDNPKNYKEMWNCPYSNDYFAKEAEEFNNVVSSPTLSMLSEASLRHNITIIGGSVPELANERLYNTCFVFGPDGKLKARHRKVHLFDIDVPGEISFRESDTFFAGDGPTIVDTDFGRIGIGICHDIRFPELDMLYREKGVHLICYPGAFNMSTGELLWELEQRARAVDNQLFVATCSPARESTGSYMIWGHSSVVDPSGEIIATTGHEESVVFTEIDYSKIRVQRSIIPINEQKRGDIYQFVDAHEQKRI